ncbi:MAG: histidine kinase [Bacteroidales bacterium]|nr:histidine kinase [Bacteroidales bacterium]
MKIQKYLTPALHVLAWIAVYFLPDLLFEAPSGTIFLVKRNLHFILVISFFYLNYFIFVPKLLLKKKQLFFFIALLASLVFTYYVNDTVMRYVHNKYGQPVQVENVSPQKKQQIEHRMQRHRNEENNGTVFVVLLGFLIGTVLCETREWYKQDRKRKEMEKEKLVSELSFLKSQVNPHFLFNSLNGIYALAIKKSDKTPDALLQLSDLLRHMLYDADHGNVLLKKEVDYLKNYIQLQRLRLPSEAKISFDVEGDLSSKTIEPLLFIPFVENAFKHGVDSEGADIRIKLSVKGNHLAFEVVNRISHAKSKDASSGIGLANVKKRLELHYGDDYVLNYDTSKGFFKVNLHLNLKS